MINILLNVKTIVRMKLELKQLAAWGASQLERSIERVAQLPKTKQRFVLEMIDTVLAQAGSAP